MTGNDESSPAEGPPLVVEPWVQYRGGQKLDSLAGPIRCGRSVTILKALEGRMLFGV